MTCMCISHDRYKGKSDVVINCIDSEIPYNSSIHSRSWSQFNYAIENKHPYYFLPNGSLLVKNVDVRSSHYFCEVINKFTKETVYKCGTAVTIIYPLILTSTPRNETVNNNTLYRIRCFAGGGDISILKLTFYVNDVMVPNDVPFPIVKDTKVECRVESGKDSLSVTGYITVKREGLLTDEEMFIQKKCGFITSGLCLSLSSPKDTYKYYTNPKSMTIVENLLQKLFSILNDKINLEYYEGECIDRFKRFVCNTFYPSCNVNNKTLSTRPICRESCQAILFMVCRKAIIDIVKQVSNIEQKIYDYLAIKTESSPNYVITFVNNLALLTKSMLNCDQLPMRLNATSNKECILINLDVNLEIQRKEIPQKKCFYEIGRNYFGEVSNTERNLKCVAWKRVPQIYLSFYQQSLQNHSNFCRNPGGVFKTPMCIITTQKSSPELNLTDVSLVPCLNIGNCKFILNRFDDSTVNYISMASSIVVALIIVLVIVVVSAVVFLSKKKKSGSRKKLDYNENIPLNNDEVNIYTNKVYKHAQNGGYLCPIYNAAHFEKVQTLAHGEYGEIVLVQAVIDNINSLSLDDSYNSNFEKLRSNKRRRSSKSIYEIYNTSIDDLILSVDKTFNEKPCWPFDKSSPSGCCPFAVIKYSANSEADLKEGRFSKETKLLSQFNHPNILRFYGVCLHISRKVSCRIVEYLPNGDIKSILTGSRRQPPKVVNNEKIKNGYQTVNALKKVRMPKNEETIKKKANSSRHSREIERPQPAENIELDSKQLLKWSTEICDAVVYLHTKHLIHRDIAARNCLVGINLEAKLADFSFVQKFSYGFDLIGNPNEYIPIRWLPKETLEDVIFNTDTDVWMFGVFLWELMSFGKEPYCNYDLNEVYDAIVSGVKLERPEKCSLEIYEQMELCFASPRQRPCLDNVKTNLLKILGTW